MFDWVVSLLPLQGILVPSGLEERQTLIVYRNTECIAPDDGKSRMHRTYDGVWRSFWVEHGAMVPFFVCRSCICAPACVCRYMRLNMWEMEI